MPQPINVNVPSVNSPVLTKTQLKQELLASEKMREYRGIFAMLMMQGILADTVKVTETGDAEQQATVMNLITDKISVRAASLDQRG